jgi:UDP-glucose 4-epimerase
MNRVKNGIEVQGGIEIMSEPTNINKNVVVTGATGYIGGTICIELKKQNYKVFGIDRVMRHHLNDFFDEFCHNDFVNKETFRFIENSNPIAIIHCAGTSLVEPSLVNPGVYFDNNVSKTNELLYFLKDFKNKPKFIFSSSAAVYGNNKYPLLENFPKYPISPYGESKLMVETILEWYKKIHDIDFISLRYFNACGANEMGIHGQMPGATHIFAQLFNAAINDLAFNLYGCNFSTMDGTCIRDYIHVTDVALAHIKAIEKNISGFFNIGTGQGTSNLECIQAVEKKFNTKLVINLYPARKGDAGFLISDIRLFSLKTNWTPERKINKIIDDLYTWYNSETYKSLINTSKRSLDAHPA